LLIKYPYNYKTNQQECKSTEWYNLVGELMKANERRGNYA